MVSTLAFSRSGTAFATSGRTLYRSTDDGVTWSYVTWFDGTLFSMTGGGAKRSGLFLQSVSGSLYRSLDDGISWVKVNLNKVLPDRIVIDSSGQLFCAEHGAIIRTPNGIAWTVARPNKGTVDAASLAVAPNGTVFAALYSRSGAEEKLIARSIDGGMTWSDVPSTSMPSGIRVMAAAPNGDLYVGTVGSGAFRSTDAGVSWIPVPFTQLPDSAVADIAIARNGSVAIVSEHGFMVSFNEGRSWSEHVYRGALAHFTAAAGGSRSLLIGSAGGILRSDPELGWEWVNTGFNQLPISMLTSTSDGRLFANDGTWYFRSDDNGATWSNLGKPGYIYEDALIGLPSGAILAVGMDTIGFEVSGAIDRSTTHGDSWERQLRGVGMIYTFAIDSAGAIFAGCEKGMMRSTDDGLTWSRFGDLAGRLSPMAIAFDGDRMIVGSQEQKVAILSHVDGTVLSESAPVYGYNIMRFLHLPSGAWIMVSWEEGIFRSTNRGDSWQKIDSLPTQCGDLIMSGEGRLYLTNFQRGVLVSDDGGETWRLENDGITSVEQLLSLAISSSGAVFVGGTPGIFAFSPPAAVPAAPAHATAPRSGIAIELRPSPASRATTLHVRLERSCSLTLRLHDTFGREVLPPRPLHLERGEHDLPLDISALAPGAYLCVVDGDAGPVATRLVVAR